MAFSEYYRSLSVPQSFLFALDAIEDFASSHRREIATADTPTHVVTGYENELEEIALLATHAVLSDRGEIDEQTLRKLIEPARRAGQRQKSTKTTGTAPIGVVFHGRETLRRYFVLAKDSDATGHINGIIMVQMMPSGGRTSTHAHQGVEVTSPLQAGMDFEVDSIPIEVQAGHVLHTLPGETHAHSFSNEDASLGRAIIVAGVGIDQMLSHDPH